VVTRDGSRWPGSAATDRDRGQLLLVSAVAVAVAIIGIAVLFNSVIYTSSISPQAASEGSNNADLLASVVESDVQRMVNRYADGQNYMNDSQRVAFVSALPAQSRRVAVAHATGSPRYVDLSYNSAATRDGVGYVQKTDSALPNNIKGSNSTLAADVTEVHEFDLDVTRFPDAKPVLLVLKNDSVSPTRFWRLRLREESPGSIEVRVRTTGESSATVVCTMSSPGTVNFTLEGESMRVDPCGASVRFGEGVDAPYDVYLDKGQTSPTGKGFYDVVLQGTDGTGGPSPVSPPPTVGVGVDVTFEDDAVSYATTRTVDVGAHPAPESGTTLLYENFENGTLDANWTTTTDGPFPGQVEIGVDSQVQHTGAYAAYVDAQTGISTTEGRIEMANGRNTTTFDDIVVDYWAQEGLPSSNGPEPAEGENLTVQYLDDSGSWVTLDRVDAKSGTIERYHRRVTVDAPAARHANFRIRFLVPVDQNSDRWYVDDVTVTGRRDG
jgi:hypothetical protein